MPFEVVEVAGELLDEPGEVVERRPFENHHRQICVSH